MVLAWMCKSGNLIYPYLSSSLSSPFPSNSSQPFPASNQQIIIIRRRSAALLCWVLSFHLAMVFDRCCHVHQYPIYCATAIKCWYRIYKEITENLICWLLVTFIEMFTLSFPILFFFSFLLYPFIYSFFHISSVLLWYVPTFCPHACATGLWLALLYLSTYSRSCQVHPECEENGHSWTDITGGSFFLCI